ncbi:hypothetical protein RchiOBHm_Chr5g0034161 [Rosa chinensis]|uniref:S1-like domain-containing protein n=1 Tax=Rosa chinensis TaxID=74649 RepID=A0A2P6QAW9_ROSCH|nr:translation initiation factor IF-1, chloroplastic isoform X1 [Rosa chinensis]PRQ31319.1 hypothetical protein RchiOBHm_Chr5g0034161 [Rosa chinensis]
MLTSTSSSSLHHPILHSPLHSKTPTLTPPSLKFQPNPKPQLHLGTSILISKRCPNIVAMSKSPKVEEQKFSAEGLVTESLPNGMFRIRLDNADNIIGYISGKIRKSFIRILPGDRVKVEERSQSLVI